MQSASALAAGLLLGACLSSPDAATIGTPPDRPQIIFDTDFGGDADDLGALAMPHHIAAAMTHVPTE